MSKVNRPRKWHSDSANKSRRIISLGFTHVVINVEAECETALHKLSVFFQLVFVVVPAIAMNKCECRVSGKPQCSQGVVLIQMFHKHCNMLQVHKRSHRSELFFISSDETTPIIAKMVSTGNWTMMWAGWVGDTILPSLIEKGFPCNWLWGHVDGQSQCERVEREEAVIGGLSKKHHFLKNVIVQA